MWHADARVCGMLAIQGTSVSVRNDVKILVHAYCCHSYKANIVGVVKVNDISIITTFLVSLCSLHNQVPLPFKMLKMK